MKLVTEDEVKFAIERTSSMVSPLGSITQYWIESGPFGPDESLYTRKEDALEAYNRKHCFRYITPQEAREWHERLPVSEHGFYWNYMDSSELDFGGGKHLSLWENKAVKQFIEFLDENNIIHDRYIDRSGNRCIKVQIS